MYKKTGTLLTLSLLLGAGLSAPTMQATAKQAALDEPYCEIRLEAHANSMTLEGLVSARGSLTGSYELQVSQRSSGGTSNIFQSGDFSLAPGETETLGTVSVSLTGGSIDATLRLDWADGSTECDMDGQKVKEKQL